MNPSTLRSEFDRKDPDAWLALKADNSIPMATDAKKAWLKDSKRWSRQFVFPLIFPFCKLLMAIIQLYKVFFPNFLTSSELLHKIIVKGLSNFVTPEGNFLLLRHFHLGSQTLNFLSRNIKGIEVDTETDALFPENIDQLKDNMVLKHDINLYNFIIDLNLELEEKSLDITPIKNLDFSMLHEPPLKVSNLPNSKFNCIDIQTAIELIIPLFQLLLTDRQFWRSTQSLQLDETIGLYFAKLLNLHSRLFLVNNKHPLIPVSTGEAGQRLALHSLSTEALHAMLVKLGKGQSL